MKRLSVIAFGVAAVLALLFTAPLAAAATITGTDFTVTLTQDGNNVNVVVTADAGFSIKTGDGNDISFNCSPNCTLTAANITNMAADGGTFTGLTFDFKTGQNIGGGLGILEYTLFGIGGGNMPANTASVTSFSFTVTGVTVAQLGETNADGTSFAAHICAAPETGCSTNTFFTGGGPIVPEPGSMLLLGTGLLGVAGMVRRRLRL